MRKSIVSLRRPLKCSVPPSAQIGDHRSLLNWANFPPGIQLLNVVRSEKALKTYRAVVEDGEVVVEV